jgi:acyl dehydratase
VPDAVVAGGPGGTRGDPRIFADLDALEQAVGAELGVSGWIEIAQDRIDRFADATEDHQWIHIDVDRAAAESPFGGTIAHGYLTLSLLPRMMGEAYRLESRGTGINYGLDRVRFVNPVRAGARVRGRLVLSKLERPKPGTGKLHLSVTVEIEGEDKPACLADAIVMAIEG